MAIRRSDGAIVRFGFLVILRVPGLSISKNHKRREQEWMVMLSASPFGLSAAKTRPCLHAMKATQHRTTRFHRYCCPWVALLVCH